MLGSEGPGKVRAWGPGDVVPALGPKGSCEVKAWGPGDVLEPRGLVEVQVLKAVNVCSGPFPAALVTSGKMPEAK